MPPRPFLYLPDALSLALLIAALTLLRRSAIAHVRQELLQLRKEMILYWNGSGFPFDDPEYQRVRVLLAQAAELAPCLSPARFFFLNRLLRGSPGGGMPPSPAIEFSGTQPASAARGKARIKLRRISLESDLAIGTFFLLGSLSGWVLLCSILIRLAARKIRGRESGNTASVFDLAEKLISRIGFHALELARFAHPPLAEY